MKIGDRVHCPFCLNPNTFEIRMDRKQRPYGVCEVCGTRTFFRTAMAMKGLSMLWGPLVRALVASDVPAAREMVETASVKAEEDLKREYAHDFAAGQ